MKVSGLILAAGLSGRMKSFKPILKINNRTIIRLIADKLLNVCEDVLIVTGYKADVIKSVFDKSDRIKFVFNNNFEKGMFTSLKIGLKELLSSDWIIYHFVDQPLLPADFYQEFVKTINENFNWIQPEYNSTKGHPLLLSRSVYQIILNESDNSSLRNISNNSQIKKLIWSCNYPQILDDIDTPEEFTKLLLREGNQL